jgi:hypothetical protein
MAFVVGIFLVTKTIASTHNDVSGKIMNIFGLVFIIYVLLIFYGAGCIEYGIYYVDGTLVKDPMSCLYFSIVTWTTLGYGDFRPSMELRLFAASEAFLGYLFMAVLIAAFLHVLSHRDPNEKP